jgi:hypothetical protein
LKKAGAGVRILDLSIYRSNVLSGTRLHVVDSVTCNEEEESGSRIISRLNDIYAGPS